MRHPTRVLVTGASGLVAHHLRARLYGLAAHAEFSGSAPQFDVVCVGREAFADESLMVRKVADADAVVHLAAVNRPREGESHADNARLAQSLIAACKAAGSTPHIVYTNSIHAIEPSGEYGRAKSAAAQLLRKWAERSGTPFAELVLPHVFGEAGRPNHNTVTSTLCANAVADRASDVREGAAVELLHADEVARRIVECLERPSTLSERVWGRDIAVSELDRRIRTFRDSYRHSIFPDLSDPLDRDLFNTYRTHEFPNLYPLPLRVHTDVRGELFEATKGGGGGQTFLSWTEPGVTRGDHFHIRKVERFLVVEGTAVIRIRRLFTDRVFEFRVTGSEPVAVDMPTLHTHSIENAGSGRLLTLFWAHEVFDPEDPDTFFTPVLGDAGDLHAP